jgi:hypothetical protein
MLREAPWIIRNGVGAVNPTSELVEPTQRHGLLAIARFGAAAILRAGRRPAVACAVRCWPLNPLWSSVLERNALRPFLAEAV